MKLSYSGWRKKDERRQCKICRARMQSKTAEYCPPCVDRMRWAYEDLQTDRVKRKKRAEDSKLKNSLGG